MIFGVEAQYLPSTEHQPLQTQWADPLVFHVKRPLTGVSIFFSHSTKDMTLVRQLEQQLDNNGVRVIIAEDKSEPGIELKRKFESKITESTIFLALLTFLLVLFIVFINTLLRLLLGYFDSSGAPVFIIRISIPYL